MNKVYLTSLTVIHNGVTRSVEVVAAKDTPDDELLDQVYRKLNIDKNLVNFSKQKVEITGRVIIKEVGLK